MEYTAIRSELDHPLARLILASPGTGNAIGARMLRDLSDACELLSDDEQVRAVVLSALGTDFCRGWEAEVFETDATGWPRSSDPFGVVAALPQPVVAAVQGECAGAGLELVLACDIRIAAENARFSQPETEGGRIPLAGGTQRLPRLAGKGTALAMVLAGEVLDASAALRAGLVTRVVPAGELQSEAEALARRIAQRGPIALRYAKEAVHHGLDMTLEQALRYETDLTVILQTTEDRAEGVRAFLESRRPPRFTGR